MERDFLTFGCKQLPRCAPDSLRTRHCDTFSRVKSESVIAFRRRKTNLKPAGERPAALASADEAAVKIGTRLRHARLVKGYLIRDVAKRSGCSVSLISKIENDRATPSLTLLHRLVGVLEINIGALFERPDESFGIVFRHGARPIIAVNDGTSGGPSVRLERIVPYGDGHLLQGNVHIVEPGAGSAGGMHHEGEEVGYVLEGRLALTVDSQTFLLEAGDAFVFNSNREHSYRNPGTALTRVLWINTPPTF